MTTVLIAAMVVVLVSGAVLTRAKRPYGVLTLTLHKLVDLAAVVALGVTLYRGIPERASLSGGEWTALAATALSVVVGLASGAIVSASEAAPRWVVCIHRIGSLVAAALVSTLLLMLE